MRNNTVYDYCDVLRVLIFRLREDGYIVVVDADETKSGVYLEHNSLKGGLSNYETEGHHLKSVGSETADSSRLLFAGLGEVNLPIPQNLIKGGKVT